MQNKTLLAIVAVAAVILLGAGGLFLFSKNKTASTPNSTVAKNATEQKEMAGEGSIKDIFTNGANKKCTFDVKSENGETMGTIYNSGKNAYGEIQVKTTNKTQKTFVIRDNETFYMWGDSFPTGIKMTLSLDEMAGKLSGVESGNQTTVTPSVNSDFKCSDWTVDSSKFKVPANVKFTDMSSVTNMNTKPTGTSQTTGAMEGSSQCSICNSLSGAAKTACLTQFSCN